MAEPKPCPCDSGLSFAQCCEQVLSGEHPAPTAQALMRSRYTAFVQVNVQHLLDSLSRKQRRHEDPEGTKQWAESAEWLGLEITDLIAGGDEDQEGVVEFIARYRIGDNDSQHHERANFVREKGNWRYDGGRVFPESQPIRNPDKVGRNEPCPCGSGKKYKKCCGQRA